MYCTWIYILVGAIASSAAMRPRRSMPSCLFGGVWHIICIAKSEWLHLIAVCCYIYYIRLDDCIQVGEVFMYIRICVRRV